MIPGKLTIIAIVGLGVYLYQSGAIEKVEEYAATAGEYCHQIVDETGIFELRELCHAVFQSTSGLDREVDGLMRDSGLDEIESIGREIDRDFGKMGREIKGGLGELEGSLKSSGGGSGGGASSGSGGCSPMKELMGECKAAK